jgi:wyosine [tRNA(Phe)-imidazoG37] synthetase (radical SAM superfamily)
MKYIYGPVSSRRLGLSLGITLTPPKACNFNCIYCQLGKTLKLTQERKEYIPVQEVFNELKLWLENNQDEAKKINYLTLSGAGEPTLNSKIGVLIADIKKITPIPVAIITNSSLLSDPQVRHELLLADLIVPSLDSVVPGVFFEVNRPHPDVKLESIIEGLVALRKEFRGKIWLEVMLVAGVNDDLRHIKKLGEVIEKINPDKIHLNSPVRTTAEEHILPVEKRKLEKIREILGDRCEII